jgi:hypothetical protein
MIRIGLGWRSLAIVASIALLGGMLVWLGWHGFPTGRQPGVRPPGPTTPQREAMGPMGPVTSEPGGSSSALAALPRCTIQLHDATDQTGIAFRHTDGSSGQHYIVETITSGLALFDYDGDGLIDIYFPNGAPLLGTKVDKPPRHALYKNLGGWRFKDVSQEAGVVCTAYGVGATVADYDNDGWPDLYVSDFGPKILYHNNGNGTFTDVTKEAGVADGDKVGAGACFLDMDGDGRLDLYVANYIKFTYQNHVSLVEQGFPIYAGPRSFQPQPHTLFRNNGNGTFTDVSVDSGIAAQPGSGMGMVCADYDNDGRTDIFVLNDVHANFFWKNDGTGKFEESALTVGTAHNGQGETLANMGVDCGDYNNDGWLDFFSTSYQRELPVLWKNLGNGTLEDVTAAAGAGAGSYNCVKWGCGMVDLDNDGYRDLFVAMGHVQDLVDHYDHTTSRNAANVVLKNMGDGTFVNVSDRCGDGLMVKLCSRGVAFDDLDNDGDIDVVVLNTREKPTILRNMLYETGSRNHWLDIRLEGVKTNRDGVGAHVRVVAGNLVQFDEVHSGRGYQSHWGSRLHFGLGQYDRVGRIEVRWISGGVDVLENVDVDRLITIREGGGGEPAGNGTPIHANSR